MISFFYKIKEMEEQIELHSEYIYEFFLDLNNLQRIRESKKIAEIKQNAFINLNNLQTLDLNENQIT